MKNVILSIIVPIYNVEKYLRNCIDSILNQTFEEFELILVNDGSPDLSLEICREYEKKDERIIVVDKENGGLSDARNVGIDIAKGKYIGFVDSDDWVEKSMYETLVYILEKYNADIAQCEYIRAENENIKKKNEDKIVEKCFDRELALDNLYNELTVSTVVAWNKIYKRELFDNIRYPKGKLHEDEFTTYKLIDRANKIAYINKKLYYYRDTPNSIVNSEYNIRRLDYFEALEERMRYFEKQENKKIVAKTIVMYYFRLVECYYRDKNINEKEELQKIINNKLKVAYKTLMNNNQIKIRSKIRGTFFRVTPKLYKRIFL